MITGVDAGTAINAAEKLKGAFNRWK